jgi:predicted secreted Zn-dependent protease
MSAQASAQGGLDWHKSRACESGACIQVARRGDSVLIGNTNDPEGPVSMFTTDEWRNFIAGVKTGDFDGVL